MPRFKTPQQKKKDSYAHNRVKGGEYPHADRKNRPRVKAFGQRELRRISKQLATSGVRLPEHLESTQRQRIERYFADGPFGSYSERRVSAGSTRMARRAGI